MFEHLRSAVSGEGETSEPEPARRPRCDVGLVGALAMELAGLEDLLSGKIATRGPEFVVHSGRLGDRGLALVAGGIGRANAERATWALLQGHQPAWVISAGFAGALREGLRHGDIVMADSLVTPSGERLAIDLKVSREALTATPGLHVGRLLTVDRVVAKSADKRKLGETHDALAVDMETYAVAELCRREKVRFMAVRVISDTVDEELPADIGRVAQQRTLVGTLGAVTGAVWRRPASFKDMLRLKQQALIASDRLARFLEGTIAQLPRATPVSTERTS